ncbi:hypothetical protein ACFY2K_03135 [Kitasatospora sp. NPDC001309]|uniref:hypothetical protein n=1 Tax=unclassified Kitasatospora TaxID=2633591 RepID=UPI00368ECA3D
MTGPAEQAEGTAVPAQRSGRHAAPRTPVRVRLRGRALAMAAVPTALLMAAAYTPNPAVAESAAGKPCGNAPVAVPDVAPVEETPVPKSELPEPPPAPTGTPGATGSPTTTPSSGPSSLPTTTPTTAPTQIPTTAPTTAPVKPPPATAATQSAVRSATTGGSGAVSAVYPGTGSGTATASRAGLIDDLVGGINHLLNPGGSATPSPSATPSATPQGPAAPAPRVGTPAQPAQPQAPAAGTQQAAPPAAQSPDGKSAADQPSGGQPSPAATASGAKAGGRASGKAAPSTTPSAGSSAAATPSGSPTANPNCDVDARNLTAGAATAEHVVPEQNWTLQTSRLGLHGAAFHGVYDVKTPTGTKRVLKFVVDSVDIENLDMSTLEGNGVTFHVQSAPGSTSTMRNGPVTMYVERLSGHLSKLLGLPIPIDLGEITLTPDTLPRWLYDLIGAIPIPLDIELTGVTAKQAGQFGGTLHIPGMHLFNDDAPYSDK